MTDKTWKAVERKYAQLFGIREGRTGPKGENWPDAIGEGYTLEVKHRSTGIPQWLLDAVEQAEHNTNLRAPGKLPLTILHKKGQQYQDGLVVLRVRDFLDWFGPDEMPDTELPE